MISCWLTWGMSPRTWTPSRLSISSMAPSEVSNISTRKAKAMPRMRPMRNPAIAFSLILGALDGVRGSRAGRMICTVSTRSALVICASWNLRSSMLKTSWLSWICRSSRESSRRFSGSIRTSSLVSSILTLRSRMSSRSCASKAAIWPFMVTMISSICLRISATCGWSSV
ncbi:MAG: hypothetical protein BWY99_02618 [Synergistetes bacterium ADurb.BinA166]|nr:MAG: hypothetical protein BWY99_02618 [Synergistetes bacterium ADurb.BinA166]